MFGSGGEVRGNLQANGPLQNSGTTITGDIILNSSGTPPPIFPDDDLEAAKAFNNNSLIQFYQMSNPEQSSYNHVWLDGSDYSDLDVGSDVIMIMPPGDYFFTRLKMGSNIEVNIDPPGKVRLFFENPYAGEKPVEMVSNVFINAGHPPQNPPLTKPGDFEILIKSGDSATFQSNGVFVGTIFAPNTDITFQSGNEIFGAVVAQRWDIQSNSYFHYDETLKQPTTSGYILIEEWMEQSPRM
jgi:hypothetical protein